MRVKSLQHLLLMLQVANALVTLAITFGKLLPALVSTCQSYLA